MNWNDLLQQVLTYVVPILIGIIVLRVLPLLVPATQNGIDWVKAQTANLKNQAVAGLLNRVVALIGQKVLAFEQTFIEDMKTKVQQGRVDPKDIPSILKEEKDKMLAGLKSELTMSGLWKDLQVVLGGDDNFIMKWIDTVLEAQVAKLPPSGLQTPSALTSAAQTAAPAAIAHSVAPAAATAPLVPQQAAAPTNA
jgi:hypothetical protein